MREVAPGLWHWRTVHERWEIEISSYLLAAEGVLIDPQVPDEGIEAVAAIAAPTDVLLTSRHHHRHSDRYVERFGCRVHCPRAGLHEVGGRPAVVPFDPGDALPGGVTALAVGALCPDETALHVPAHRSVAFGDAIVRMPPDAPLAFVPDGLMDDPPATKAGLLEAFRRILALPFTNVLLAHGDPLIGDGRERLAAFVAENG